MVSIDGSGDHGLLTRDASVHNQRRSRDRVGICCSQRWWQRQREELAGQLRLVSIDLRGIGGSAHVVHGHRVARYSADVAELIARLDLRGVVLVGWSLGASLSLGLVELAGEERLSGSASPHLTSGRPRSARALTPSAVIEP